MGNEVARTARIAQMLIDEGWQFIDNGYDEIKKAENTSTGKVVTFNTDKEFTDWLFKQK